MADVLNSILTGRIQVNDLLTPDSLEKSVNVSDFIPYFLNYVKDECSWLILRNVKNVQPLSSKCMRSPNKQQIYNFHNSFYQTNSINSSGKNFTKDCERNKKETRSVGNPCRFSENETKNNIKVTDKEYVLYDEPKNNHQRYTHKSDYSAKKCLNFKSVKEVKSNILNNLNACAPDINNFDAFPPIGSINSSKPNDTKIRRRITPTPVQNHKGTSKFGSVQFSTHTEKTTNEVFKMSKCIENQSSDLQSEREMLKMTRNKLSQLAVTSSVFCELKKENMSPVKSLSICYITPDPDLMCQKNELETFSSIYDKLITYGLVPNVTSELYFMFELITSKVSSDETIKDGKSVFSSIHNCVYFAVLVLSKQQSLLNLLDHNTLLSLCDVSYLLKFSPQLVNFLQNYGKAKQEIIPKTQFLNQVPFSIDEDCKDNFIDAQSFTSFRKQRDLFYELLREWQQQPLDCIDAKFREKFLYKAKLLISLGPNAVNIHHLAKLIQNQLIASCLGLEVNEVSDEILSDIEKNFPGKIAKLRERFIKPYCTGEPNPPPTFYGIQSFFCELIQAIDSTLLNQQLQDIFVCRILDLNESELNSHDCIKEKYIFLLHTLRLLGKFFGYLHFLPYHVPQSLSASIVNYQLVSRRHSVPPLDIVKLLKESIKNNRVIVTVPWVVEYLSMADPVAKNIPYIEETLKILTAIYRGKYFLSSDSLNFWFLRVIIGWLFDVLYYPVKFYSFVHTITFEKNIIVHESIDFLPIIDKQLIHSCCPYLIEFKILIYNFLNGFNGKREIRKITPLLTSNPQISTSLAKQQMETQLEENFFFLHPQSLKKCVEFVSDRIASKIINRIRSEVTNLKLECVQYISNQKMYKELLKSKPDSIQKLQSYVNSYVSEMYEKFYSKIKDLVRITCSKEIEEIMPHLLSDDINPSVLEMCCKIAFRYAADKIFNWCETNLILEAIKCDIINKLNHLSKAGNDSVIKKDAIDLSSVLSSLRRLIVKILSGSFNPINEHYNILLELSSVMSLKISTSSKKLMAFMTIDLCIAILIHCPEICSKELNESFILIWSMCPKSYELESYFLGVQNIKLLISAKSQDSSCEKLCILLNDLINKNIFCIKRLELSLRNFRSFQSISKADQLLLSINRIFSSIAIRNTINQ